MKVLVVGSGGREHALCWKIAKSPLVEAVLALPGNPGTARVARNVEGVAAEDVASVVRVAKEEEIDLVVIGPEGPLCAGLADGLRAEGIAVFGPGEAGAQLEGSKLFAKEMLDRHRIPTGSWKRFDRAGAAKDYLEGQGEWPLVIKADGLAAGKGVFVVGDSKEACQVVDQVMEERQLGDAGGEILIEEFIVGQEVSIHVVTDGETLLVLDPVEDHKQVGEGDTGPNTGGMGVASPVTWLGRRLMHQIEQRILIPMMHALRIEGIPYQGLLYAGLMITEGGPKVLEFNCRFGDPETQAIMRRFQSDLVPYLMAAAEGRLDELAPPDWDKRTCVGVVMCAEGYPGDYRKGDPILGIDRAEALGVEAVVFQAGTRQDGPALLSNGGRVLCVTALGEGVDGAREGAYAAAERVRFDGAFYRHDIGKRPVTISTGV